MRTFPGDLIIKSEKHRAMRYEYDSKSPDGWVIAGNPASDLMFREMVCLVLAIMGCNHLGYRMMLLSTEGGTGWFRISKSLSNVFDGFGWRCV